MVIENAQYFLIKGTNINSCINCTIDGVTISVPIDPNNRHYAEIQKQVADGTLTIADAE